MSLDIDFTVHKVDHNFPAHLTRPPGLVGIIIDWIEATARVPNRTLAMGSALTVVGTAMARYWYGPTKATMGLYVLGIGPTASGKGHVLQSIVEMMLSAGMQSRLSLKRFQSERAITEVVKEKPACVCCFDEVEALMRRNYNIRSGTREHPISQFLRAFWSANRGSKMTAAWASTRAELIVMPQLSIIGMTTPEKLFKVIDGSTDVANGLLNRMLLLSSTKRSEERDPLIEQHTVPFPITNGLRGLWCGGDATLRDASNNYTVEPATVRIPWENDAVEAAYKAFEKEFVARCDKEPGFAPFLARVAETAVRLATIVAGGQNNLKPSVTMADWEWGKAVALWSAEEIIHMVSTRVALTKADAAHRPKGALTADSLVMKETPVATLRRTLPLSRSRMTQLATRPTR